MYKKGYGKCLPRDGATRDGLNEILLDGFVHHINSIVDPQFFHNVKAMGFYGAQTFAQRIGDLFVVLAIDDHAQDLFFPFGQVVNVFDWGA